MILVNKTFEIFRTSPAKATLEDIGDMTGTVLEVDVFEPTSALRGSIWLTRLITHGCCWLRESNVLRLNGVRATPRRNYEGRD